MDKNEDGIGVGMEKKVVRMQRCIYNSGDHWTSDIRLNDITIMTFGEMHVTPN